MAFHETDAPIPLRLEVGDALQWPADLAWIGTGSLLRQRVETLSGQKFATLDLRDFGRPQRSHGNLLAGVDLLVAHDFAWKQVLSVHSRPSRRVRPAHADTMESVVGLVRRAWRPRQLLLVPWRHEPAEFVAMSMLFHVWCVRRYANAYGTPKFPEQITIIDLQNVEIFRELIGPRRGELQAYIDLRLRRRIWTPRNGRKTPVLFEQV